MKSGGVFLRLHLIHHHIPVINIPVAGDFPAVAAVVFDDFREIVIHGIEFQTVIAAPIYSGRKSVAKSAGPEDEFVAVGF